MEIACRRNLDSQTQTKFSKKSRQGRFHNSILARDALQKIKDKRRQEADDRLKRAKRVITVAENKAKNALRERGVQARKDEKARQVVLKQTRDLLASKSLIQCGFRFETLKKTQLPQRKKPFKPIIRCPRPRTCTTRMERESVRGPYGLYDYSYRPYSFR